MINVTTDPTGTTAEVTTPPPGLVLVPDPQWVVAPHEVDELDRALVRWRAAATACGGECQHVAALFEDARLPLRGACVDDDGDPIGLVDILDLDVLHTGRRIDDLATTIRVSRRSWADGQSEEIVLAYGGGRTEAVLEIQQHTHIEWGGQPLAEVTARRLLLRAVVYVRLREWLEPMGDPDMWWASLRASYEARVAAAGLTVSSDRW